MASDEKETRPSLDRLGLDDGERCVLEEQVTLVSSSAGYLTLFRYATTLDRFIFIASVAACMAAGAASPMMMASEFPNPRYWSNG